MQQVGNGGMQMLWTTAEYIYDIAGSSEQFSEIMEIPAVLNPPNGVCLAGYSGFETDEWPASLQRRDICCGKTASLAGAIGPAVQLLPWSTQGEPAIPC
jgi:hypothetical protein